MSGLHVASTGQGPDLVLLHGWGMHGGVFAALLPHLDGFRVHRVDLPGHGHSPWQPPFALPALARAVHAAVAGRLAGPALWAGWSLGGMVALQAAVDFPEAVAALALIAAAPRFSAAGDWPHGMAADNLAGFGARLAVDHAGVLQRFLALQTYGEPDARATLRTLREALAGAPAPRPEALAAGLEILQHADLRPAWRALACPALLIGGGRDRLIHPAALAAAAELQPGARLHTLDDAGHAPFVARPDAVAACLREFAHAA